MLFYPYGADLQDRWSCFPYLTLFQLHGMKQEFAEGELFWKYPTRSPEGEGREKLCGSDGIVRVADVRSRSAYADRGSHSANL